jgi:hypothetical protein
MRDDAYPSSGNPSQQSQTCILGGVEKPKLPRYSVLMCHHPRSSIFTVTGLARYICSTKTSACLLMCLISRMYNTTILL